MSRACRRPSGLAAVLLVAAALGGCGRAPDGILAAGPAAEPAPQRLVSLAPNLTELVFALGLGERLVGVGDYDVLPPGAPELPRLGGLLDPNLEALIGLRPDLVLLLPSQQEVADQMQRVGVASLVVAAEDTIADVEEAALAIAARCGVEEAGRELVAGLRRELAPRPGPAKSVLVVVARAPGSLAGLTAAGDDTFYDDLLERLGAGNAAAAAPMRYPQLGPEALVAHPPDVIVELQGTPPVPAAHAAIEADWQRLPTLPAVRDDCVVVVAGSHVFVPGPRLPELYADLERAVRNCGDSPAPAGDGPGAGP